MPPKSGAQVKFTQDGKKILVQQARMKSSMNVIDDEAYPDWDMFDGSNLEVVQGLGQRVAMVEWAAGDGDPPLSGVYLDGEHAYATDRYKLVRVPCKINIKKPIIIPSGILGQCLKSMGDTGMGVSGTQLLLAPDDWTQLRTVIYDMAYVPVKMLFDTMKYELKIEINKSELLDKLNRAGSYTGAERNPVITTYWGRGEIAVVMQNAEIGLFGDVVELPGQLDHKRVINHFTPKYLIDSLNNAPDEKVELHYDATETNPKIAKSIKIVSGIYECIVMKRQASQPSS